MSIAKNHGGATINGVVGMVIAGGAGERLGQVKHTVAIGEQTLLDHVTERLAPQVTMLSINMSKPQPSSKYPVLIEGTSGIGPLAGVFAGLVWAQAEGANYLLTVPVDVPFFPHNLAERLCSYAQPSSPCFAVDEQQGHFLCALWPTALMQVFSEALHLHDVRSVRYMHDVLHSKRVMFDGPGYDQFMNINTPDDLAAARKLWKRIS